MKHCCAGKRADRPAPQATAGAAGVQQPAKSDVKVTRKRIDAQTLRLCRVCYLQPDARARGLAPWPPHSHACRLRPTLSLRSNRIPRQLKLMNKEEVAAAASLIEIALSPLFARQFAVKRRQNDAKSLLSTRVRRYRGVGAPSISKHQNSFSKLIINPVFL